MASVGGAPVITHHKPQSLPKELAYAAQVITKHMYMHVHVSDSAFVHPQILHSSITVHNASVTLTSFFQTSYSS